MRLQLYLNVNESCHTLTHKGQVPSSRENLSSWNFCSEVLNCETPLLMFNIQLHEDEIKLRKHFYHKQAVRKGENLTGAPIPREASRQGCWVEPCLNIPWQLIALLNRKRWPHWTSRTVRPHKAALHLQFASVCQKEKHVLHVEADQPLFCISLTVDHPPSDPLSVTITPICLYENLPPAVCVCVFSF